MKRGLRKPETIRMGRREGWGGEERGGRRGEGGEGKEEEGMNIQEKEPESPDAATTCGPSGSSLLRAKLAWQ